MDIAELINTEELDTVKKHPCKWVGCRKSFGRPSDATRHYRIHTNDRPFQCTEPYCGKRFIQRSALTVHFRTHSGERPHVCEVESCCKRFSDSSSLARHRRIHTDNRPYKCHECNRSYTKKTVLIQHGRLCHNKQQQWNALPSPPASHYEDTKRQEDDDPCCDYPLSPISHT
ncbi:unnamed protein product [Mucor hiemalis]